MTSKQKKKQQPIIKSAYGNITKSYKNNILKCKSDLSESVSIFSR